MRSIFPLFCFCLLAILFVPAKHGDKHFFCTDGSSIILSGDKLIFYPSDYFSNRSVPPTICSVKKINGSFYEITSCEEPLPNVLKEYSISTIGPSQKHHPLGMEDTDMRLVFHVPYESSLFISIVALSGKERYSFVFNQNNTSIIVPRDSLGGSLHLRISPERIHSQDYYGRYHGIVEAFLDDVYLGSPHEVHITIPNMDASFFEKYLIVKDILQIKKNSILWHGRLYVSK